MKKYISFIALCFAMYGCDNSSNSEELLDVEMPNNTMSSIKDGIGEHDSYASDTLSADSVSGAEKPALEEPVDGGSSSIRSLSAVLL